MASKLQNIDLGKRYEGVSTTALEGYGQIYTNIQEGVDKLRARRAMEDADIELKAAETQKVLDEAMQTAANNASEVNMKAVQYAQQASDRMLAYKTMFQNGKMKSQDFLTRRTNLMRGAQNVQTLINKIDEKRVQVMERMKAGTLEGNSNLSAGQYLEQFLGEEIEGYKNFRDQNIVVNNDGNTFFAKVNNGVVSSNPADYREVSGAVKQLDVQYNNFDLNSYSTEVADKLATIDIGFRSGAYTSIKDALQKSTRKADIEKYLDDKWGEITANPYNVTSMITDQMEGFENYTYDPSEADTNPNLILIKRNGQTGDYDGVDTDHKNFKAWSEKAKEKYMSEVKAQVDRVTKAREYKPTPYDDKRYQRQLDKSRAVKTLGVLGSTFANLAVEGPNGEKVMDENAMNAAVRQLEGLRLTGANGKAGEIVQVKRGNEGTILVFDDVIQEKIVDPATGAVTGYKERKVRREKKIPFQQMNIDQYVSALYSTLTGQVIQPEYMNAFRSSPTYVNAGAPDLFFMEDGTTPMEFGQFQGNIIQYGQDETTSGGTVPLMLQTPQQNKNEAGAGAKVVTDSSNVIDQYMQFNKKN